MDLSIPTQRKRQVIDLTDQVQDQVPAGLAGLVNVAALHTTASVTTADLDPGTDLDLLDALKLIIPDRSWRHPHNPEHAPDHLLASIVGPSVSLPVASGQILLGTWQRIILIEFDGPKARRLRLTFVSS